MLRGLPGMGLHGVALVVWAQGQLGTDLARCSWGLMGDCKQEHSCPGWSDWESLALQPY